MAYNKSLKDEIDAMGAGDLVHFMLATFEPLYAKDGDNVAGPWMQPEGYSWAHERLNELLPSDTIDETIAAASDAADAAAHGF